MNNTKEIVSKNTQVSSRQQTYIGITKAGGDILGVMFNGALLTFYVDILHMDPELFGIVMIIFAIWNAINDPIFGFMSDKKSMDNRGKRSFFIRFSSPIFFIGFLMFWLASPSMSKAAFFVFLLIALFIFDTGLTIFGLNLSAIQVSQTTDTKERTKIAIIASVISFLPVGIAAILPNIVLTSNIALIYIRLIFIGMGIISVVFMLVGSFKLKELSLEKEGIEPLSIWPAIKETLKMRSFLTFVLVNFMFTAVSFNIVAVMPLYFKYVSQIGDWTVLWVSLPIGLLQVPLYFLYGKIQNKIGIKYSVFLITGIMLVGFIGLFFSRDIYSTTLCYGLCLWMTTFYFIIVNPMVGDIADEDELKTGRRREGMFFGINALITKPASSLIVLFFTLIISYFGYNSELDVQTLEAQFGLRLGLSILSIAFLVAALIPLIFYPLYGEKIAQIKNKLVLKHNNEQKLLSDIKTQKEEELC
ncbi:MAG TPA: MFS transporter [candidate division Zixibacteria bacterium]|nr:MFS transporter [candidate division Zixibacteria bacterium]